MELFAGKEANAGKSEDQYDAALILTPASATDVLPSQLAREYAVLASVTANMSSGFILLNASSLVTYFNESALRLLSLSREQLLDTPAFDARQQLLALARDPQRAQTNLNQAWLDPAQESSMAIALSGAVVRWLRVQLFPVHTSSGQLLGRGILLDDITSERAAMESRSETLALAAHELKTPLAVIKGCATTLLGNASRWDPAVEREMLQMIDTQADRLYEVLNTLLDVWKLDAGAQTLRLSAVYLPHLLKEVVERWQKHIPDRDFTLRIPQAIPEITCDAARFEQALNALLNNAVKYTPRDGAITICLENAAAEVRLSITDTGAGIASEHLDHIFDRFYRVQQGDNREDREDREDREGGEGRGLGLAVARAIIEAHGGKIWADSPGLGQGTTFYLTLPLTPRRQSSIAAQAPSPLSLPTAGQSSLPMIRSTARLKHSQRPHLLVAEGDARLSRYLRANLDEHAYAVQVVSSGVHFLLQLDLDEPDLILLSTRLADTGGAAILQRVREFSQTPVMMLSDNCDEEERVRLFEMGADDLVIKPFGMQELLARVRALLRRSASSTDQTHNQALFVNGDLTIDYAQHLVMLDERPVQLSRTEYKLLSTLAQNVGIVLTHEILLERVWGPEYNREVDFIWVYISRLRRKIEADPRHPRYILTVPDVGYKLAKV